MSVLLWGREQVVVGRGWFVELAVNGEGSSRGGDLGEQICLGGLAREGDTGPGEDVLELGDFEGLHGLCHVT
jgi:hypothetical protein